MKKILLFCLFLIGCPITPMEHPAPARPTPQVKDTNYCSLAEKHLKQLGCEEAKPLKDGTTFTQFCEATQGNGVFLNPKCLSQIKSCSEVDSCTFSK